MPRYLWILTVLTGGWLVLWRRLGDRWGWLGMLNAWAEWGVAALGGLSLVGLLRGRWIQSLLALSLAGVGVERINGGPAGERGGGPVTRPTGSVTLFVANLYRKSRDMEPHLSLIRRYQPDVVCLQELTQAFGLQVERGLRDLYPYRIYRARSDSYGFAVLSRFPIDETGMWDRPGVCPWGQRVLCYLDEGRKIEIYNVHLVPPAADSTFEQGMTWGFRAREAQVRFIQDEIQTRGLPACVVGDHNFSDSSDAYHIALESLSDAWQVSGKGSRWTWPTRGFPLSKIPWNPRMLRLDYCFHSQQVRPLEMQVITERTGSDHCPLLVTLAID
jgi:endonuclease/exonuclease/phosphatase family metal-dependent hydrolase